MQKGNIRQFFGDFSGYITRKTYNPFSEPRFILEKGYELGGIAVLNAILVFFLICC